MITTALCLLLVTAPTPMEGQNGMLWLESVGDMKSHPNYSPKLRFQCWDISSRYPKSQTYMFRTPGFVQQGTFTSQGNNFYFRAVMANEIEVADKDKLIQGMDPSEAFKVDRMYTASMSNFTGVYNPKNRSLRISYPVRGQLTSYTIYPANEGEDSIPNTRQGLAKSVVGLWFGQDPYPQRMDARSRQKYQEDGLQYFFKEAGVSDARLLSVISLRGDGNYRADDKIGTWTVDQGMVILDGGRTGRLSISKDGRFLLDGNTPMLGRN